MRVSDPRLTKINRPPSCSNTNYRRWVNRRWIHQFITEEENSQQPSAWTWPGNFSFISCLHPWHICPYFHPLMVICHLHETISHLKSIIFKYKLKLFHRICISIIWDFSNIQTQHHKHLQPELFVLGLLLLLFFFPALLSHHTPTLPPSCPFHQQAHWCLCSQPRAGGGRRSEKEVERLRVRGGRGAFSSGFSGCSCWWGEVSEENRSYKTDFTSAYVKVKKKKNLPSNKEKKQEETRVSWRLNTGIKMFTAEHHGPFCTINFFFPLRTEGFWWLFVFPQW